MIVICLSFACKIAEASICEDFMPMQKQMLISSDLGQAAESSDEADCDHEQFDYMQMAQSFYPSSVKTSNYQSEAVLFFHSKVNSLKRPPKIIS